MEVAVRLHQSGNLQQAESIYRQILAVQADHADALQFLGMLLHQLGRTADAWEFVNRAVAASPSNPRFLCNAAAVLRSTGRLDEAISYCHRAIELSPQYAEAHGNLADALAAAGRLDEAVASYHRAIELRPNWAQMHHHLGVVLKARGEFDKAEACYRQAVAVEPNLAEAWNDLGTRLRERGRFDDAISCCRRALSCRQDFSDALNNLGAALLDNGDPHEAAGCFRRVLAAKPNDPQIHHNLASALRETGELPAAAAAARAALKLRPGWEEARFNLASIQLLSGDLIAGWRDCEARWERRAARKDGCDGPPWDDSELAGRRILLRAEHGFGDNIQFIRYAPLVAAKGAQVVILCHPSLCRLFACLGMKEVAGNDQALPPFDAHCSVMSLPRIFGTTLETIPANVPYLKADPNLIDRWRGKLASHPVGLKVGLAWAGSPEFREDRFRSPHLPAMAPLGGIAEVQFYSLQKGYAAAEARQPPAGFDLIDWTDEIEDFADTAALVENLDLVISSDTAVVHLAGAMGKPVWVLLPFAPGVFWMLGRSDSPWYPTMRLFRQPQPKDWQSVIVQVAEELRKLAVRRLG